MAGVDISLLGHHVQCHQDLEGPVSIADQIGGRNPSCFLLAIPEPADSDVAWVEICHRADQHIVVVESLCLGQRDGHLGVLWGTDRKKQCE